MSKITFDENTAYLTSANIVHPSSSSTVVTAAEAAARSVIGARTGVTVSGGSIKKRP